MLDIVADIRLPNYPFSLEDMVHFVCSHNLGLRPFQLSLHDTIESYLRISSDELKRCLDPTSSYSVQSLWHTQLIRQVSTSAPLFICCYCGLRYPSSDLELLNATVFSADFVRRNLYTSHLEQLLRSCCPQRSEDHIIILSFLAVKLCSLCAHRPCREKAFLPLLYNSTIDYEVLRP
eukprot:Blabericola_migrator_1__10811@NODE_6211_length_578_cov_2_565558_g4182_i0_p1_GENE_NODE_6211_length_578_cov_2_565558_g4182_i0NODE_6211_length_578_cov_2_565558_g4182_i0_p1_ORF_typecomplete_len177_score10_09zf_C2H2_6/PF18450_1/1_9e02zf_C2H2_6/PF18450_1/0_19_NODE_6211_length_578_cov_2_565558_g4182_i048578